MIRLPKDFKEFLNLLNQHKVLYLIVGGYAVGYYGYPRATGDIDVWVQATKRNSLDLKNALEAFGFNISEIAYDSMLQPGKILRLGYPPLRIEILNTISGVQFQDCYERRNECYLDEIKVPMISFHDLLANKKAAGRPKDLADVHFFDQTHD
jgi:hypothetical protein